jgi:transcriptional regulator NrdR family protein
MRKCPQCGHRSIVYDTRETETTIRRARRCIKCGNKWTTFESCENAAHRVKQLEELIARVRRDLVVD